LPRIWRRSLAAKFKNTFYSKERIVRFIYNDLNINATTKILKANFVAFQNNQETDKFELSCVRFELDSLENSRTVGKSFEDASQNRKYYGLACIDVATILEWESHSLAFTPKADSPFHVDIYDSLPLAGGRADNAAINLKREMFRRVWKVHQDIGAVLKESVQPIKGARGMVEYLREQNAIK
jgi:hypothetical protein